tara:strand:- start:3174 stop:3722 length:549 start_codon:yes stop_codon:yes gene_type:complete
MKMLIARAKGVVGALAVFGAVSGFVSGCALVEQIDAIGKNDRRVSVPTVSDLRSQVDWAAPEDFEAAAARTKAKRVSAGDANVPRPKTKPEIVDPRTLVGLDKMAIEEILGAPQHITLTQPATVWAWEQDGCRMRLFFYPDLAAQKFRALTYEISADQPKKNAMLIETCASRIKWANAKTPR